MISDVGGMTRLAFDPKNAHKITGRNKGGGRRGRKRNSEGGRRKKKRWQQGTRRKKKICQFLEVKKKGEEEDK